MNDNLRDEIVQALKVHRWKTIDVSTVECECGEILGSHSSLVSFRTDKAFFAHLADVLTTIIESREELARQIAAGHMCELILERDAALAKVARHGECTCSYVEPDEFCPRHGRPYAEMVDLVLAEMNKARAERDAALAKVARVEACENLLRRSILGLILEAGEHGNPGSDEIDYPIGMDADRCVDVADLRTALANPDVASGEAVA